MKEADLIEAFHYGATDEDYSSALRIRGNELLYDSWGTTVIAIRKNLGAGIFFLINGDQMVSRRWGNGTPQWSAITKLTPNVQIPFSALRSAGVNPQNIHIVENRKDRTWYTCPKCNRAVRPMFNQNTKEYDYFHCYGYRELDATSPICLDENGRPLNSVYHHELGAVLFRVGRKYYLSSVDEQEANRNYFLCELAGRYKTVEDAFEGLKPPEVQRANAEDVIRQGEVFLVKTDKTFPKHQIKKAPDGRVRILGIRHYATEVVEICNQRGKVLKTYCRGTLKHATTGNKASWGRGGPEHRRVTMGKQWHQAFKNTAKGSWQASGGVD